MTAETPGPASAVALAADVRAGRRRAADIVEHYLAAIGERDGDVHAFNHVMAGRGPG